MTELRERIQEVIQNEPVALFMKGTPQFVMCGNSERALRALREAGAPVTAVDILPDPRIRQELSALSGWPTIPQVFVRGELVGGADIVEELAASGDLERTLGTTFASASIGARIRSPTTGCVRISAHSSSSRAERLLRTDSGMRILPMSCRSAPSSIACTSSSLNPRRRATATARSATSCACALV